MKKTILGLAIAAVMAMGANALTMITATPQDVTTQQVIDLKKQAELAKKQAEEAKKQAEQAKKQAEQAKKAQKEAKQAEKKAKEAK